MVAESPAPSGDTDRLVELLLLQSKLFDALSMLRRLCHTPQIRPRTRWQDTLHLLADFLQSEVNPLLLAFGGAPLTPPMREALADITSQRQNTTPTLPR